MKQSNEKKIKKELIDKLTELNKQYGFGLSPSAYLEFWAEFGEWVADKYIKKNL